jgi:hypothetical protein
VEENLGPEVFLLRVWSEPRELPGQLAVYRGRIEHAGRGRVQYLASLAAIPDFVRSCLLDSDLPPGAFEDEPPGTSPDGPSGTSPDDPPGVSDDRPT